MLKDFAHYVVYSVLGLVPGNRLSDVVEFFVFDVIKIFLLLSVIIFAVSIIRSYFPPERTKRILSHKREFIGNILAALLDIVNVVRYFQKKYFTVEYCRVKGPASLQKGPV